MRRSSIRRLYPLSLLTVLTIPSLTTGADPAPTLPWPVDAKPALTSTFCEYRPGHFHSGVDIKTYGQVGPPCRAVSDGWVSRVKVSTGGYGRALYLKLENGEIAVYAHLDRFAPPIETIVQEEQHRLGNFSVELFFDKGEALKFRRGEVVGFAGRSGVKHPHLHFEIRDASQRPLNPQLNGIETEDSQPPVPVALSVTPLDAESSVEGDCQPRLYRQLTRHNDGTWSAGDPMGIRGRVGLAVDAYDKTDVADNLLAVQYISLAVNGEVRWETDFRRFYFNDTRKMELERDYRLLRRGEGIFHRLFRMPGNDLDILRGNGVIDTAVDSLPLKATIVLRDAAGNASEIVLTFVNETVSDEERVIGGRPLLAPQLPGGERLGRVRLDMFDGFFRLSGPPGISGFNLDGRLELCLPVRSVGPEMAVPWVPPADFSSLLTIEAVGPDSARVERVEMTINPVIPGIGGIVTSSDGRVLLDIPPGGVYDTIWVRILPEPSLDVPGAVSGVYRVEPLDQPLARAVTVRIRRRGGEPVEPGWGLYYLDKRKGWTFLGRDTTEGGYAGPALSWEVFGLVKDVKPPELAISSPPEDASLSNNQPRLLARIRDDLSGLTAAGLSITLDNHTVPAEYDPPRDRLLYTPWRPLEPGRHSYGITVEDQAGNVTTSTRNFVVTE